MNASVARLVWSGLFLVGIFGSGFWLTRSGRPYNGTLFTIHKLIALAAVVFLAVTIYRLGRSAGLGGWQLAAGIAAGLCFVALIVTGGLLSALKVPPPAIRTVHHILPYLALLCTGAGLVMDRAISCCNDGHAPAVKPAHTPAKLSCCGCVGALEARFCPYLATRAARS